MSIPLPNQIKVAPKPIPEPEESSAKSTSGSRPKTNRKDGREIRPMTQRLGRLPEFAETFKAMGKAAEAAKQHMVEYNDQERASRPKGVPAQQEPIRNKRRTGRRAQRP